MNLTKPYTPLLIVVVAGLIYAIWNYAQPFLLIASSTYVASGMLIRIGGIVRRRLRHNS